MTRRRIVIVLVAALAVIVGWRASRSDSSAPVEPHSPAARGVDPAFADTIARGRDAIGRSGAIRPGFNIPAASDGNVAISGTVLDAETRTGVAGVEVVFRSPIGESSTTSAADGTYRIDVVPGVYRAFVRDDSVLSVGKPDHVRLPHMPSADAAGVPDEELIPSVVARADTKGLDLSVLRGGEVAGRVVDSHGRPVAGVVLQAHSNLWRPALGTDIVESDADGSFAMRLPHGGYIVEATHPLYAGIDHGLDKRIVIQAGGHTHADFTLAAGCVISGHVVGADGKASGDGAIERKWGETDTDFGPTGQIGADGTFRWATTEEIDVTLRAWPWKSPPSPSRTFACKDGARYPDVVFTLPKNGPDLEGVLVDHDGAPVPFAFIDVAPTDVGFNQQERTDAQGHWGVYNMPAGRYVITAYAPERGVVATSLTAPIHDARLTLGGTGKVEGTATDLTNGSFEVELGNCELPGGGVPIPHEPRLVTVIGGRFTIDALPACHLTFSARWHGHELEQDVSVPVDGVAEVELDLGPPRAKAVHGIVRDDKGQPVAGASITVFVPSGPDDETRVTTDASGRYSLQTVAGAMITATIEHRFGQTAVGRGSTGDEEVDIALAPMDYDMDVEGQPSDRPTPPQDDPGDED